jgi:hypothetical protein
MPRGSRGVRRIRRAQVNPVLGREVVERRQFVNVVGDLPGGLGPLRAVRLSNAATAWADADKALRTSAVL